MKIFVFQDIEQNIPSFPQKTVWFVLFFVTLIQYCLVLSVWIPLNCCWNLKC